MPRTVLVTLHYDGGRFAGWQRQADDAGRTVQAEVERVLEHLTGEPIRVHAAGRTDAGVHAVGMPVSAIVPDRWEAAELRRALNALLPADCWAAACREMRAGFHARRCATQRRYRYVIGTDDGSRSPFRRRFEWALGESLDGGALARAAGLLEGEHDFGAFSVRSSFRPHRRCRIVEVSWTERAGCRGFVLEIAADRFLHHMVRMLVGTMTDIARGRRDSAELARLLALEPAVVTSPPAPPQGLYFVSAEYPAEWLP
ncbi:MAG: tRNA pseudouridine(38-40) synthase TruA [Gemmatimonadales bacterium]